MRFDPNRWYFRTYVYIVAFLCIGPLALPLAWINPRYNRSKKVIVTVITLIATYFLTVIFVRSTESIVKYYQQLLQLSR